MFTGNTLPQISRPAMYRKGHGYIAPNSPHTAVMSRFISFTSMLHQQQCADTTSSDLAALPPGGVDDEIPPLLIHPLPLRLYAVIAIILLRQQPFLQRICNIISAFPKSLILRVSAVLNCT